MMASVSSPFPAWPRSLWKRLAGCFLSALVSTTLPSAARWKSTLLPGTIPSRSRTAFGIVTCPFAVTVVVIFRDLVIPHASKVLPSCTKINIMWLFGDWSLEPATDGLHRTRSPRQRDRRRLRSEQFCGRIGWRSRAGKTIRAYRKSAGKSRRSILEPSVLPGAHLAVVIVAAVDHRRRRNIETPIALQRRIAITGDRGDAQ